MFEKLVAAVCVAVLASWGVHARAQTESVTEIRELSGKGRYPEALERLERLLAGDPDNVEARLLKGVVLTKSGDPEQAIEVFKALADEHPNLPEPHNNLAVLYAGQSRLEDARVALVKAITLQPGYDTAHENLGDIHAKLAILSYRRSHDLNSDNVRARNKAELIEHVFQKQATAAGVPRPAQESEQPAQESARPAPEPSQPVAVAPSQSAPDTAPPASAPGTAPAPSASACFSVAAISHGAAASAVADWFVERGANATVKGGSSMYQVYVGPFATPQQADEKIAEMRAAGVVDIIRIHRGELKNGVALGVYSKEPTAARRAAELAKLGYNAQYRERPVGDGAFRVAVRVSNPAQSDVAEFASAFPDYSLETRPCATNSD